MAGEEAIVHERLVSVTSAGAGELAAKVFRCIDAWSVSVKGFLLFYRYFTL